MIVYVDKDHSYVRDQGCGCCCNTYCTDVDQSVITDHLRKNIEVTIEACNLIGKDFKELVQEVNPMVV